MKLGAVILAGGESRRMGRDKAWLWLGGKPLIARTLSILHESDIQEVLISGRAGTDYSTLGCPVLFDLDPGCGPLSGIDRALSTVLAPMLLVLAVDLPLITPSLIQRLAAQCDDSTGIVPELHGRLEPLAAIYPRSCGVIARECLLKSQRSARHFAAECLRIQAVRAYPVPDAEAGCFENWNSPADITLPHPLSLPK